MSKYVLGRLVYDVSDVLSFGKQCGVCTLAGGRWERSAQVSGPNRDEQILCGARKRDPIFGLVYTRWWGQVVVCSAFGHAIDLSVVGYIIQVDDTRIDKLLQLLLFDLAEFIAARSGRVAVSAFVIVVKVGRDPRHTNVSVWVVFDVQNCGLP